MAEECGYEDKYGLILSLQGLGFINQNKSQNA